MLSANTRLLSTGRTLSGPVCTPSEIAAHRAKEAANAAAKADRAERKRLKVEQKKAEDAAKLATKTEGFRSNLFADATESDTGQETTNVFIIAKRHIKTGQGPTAEVITKLLKLAVPVTAEEFAICEAAYANRTAMGTLATVGKAFRKQTPQTGKGRNRSKVSGVYLGTSTFEHAAAVGSSVNLHNRLDQHSTGGSPHITNQTRMGQYGATNGKGTLTMEVLVLPPHLTGDPRMAIVLEQWCMLKLFGELGYTPINMLLVASSGANDRPYTEAQRLEARKVLGVPLYVYANGALIHTFFSMHQATQLLEVYKTLLSILLTKHGGVIADSTLRFSQTLESGVPEDPHSEEAVKALFDAERARHTAALQANPGYRVAARGNGMVLAKSVNVTAVCDECGKVLTATSMTKLHKQLLGHSRQSLSESYVAKHVAAGATRILHYRLSYL